MIGILNIFLTGILFGLGFVLLLHGVTANAIGVMRINVWLQEKIIQKYIGVTFHETKKDGQTLEI